MNDLDDTIVRHYSSRLLNDRQIDRILSTNTQRPSEGLRRSNAVQWGLAACLLLAVTIGMHSFGTINERTGSALREAAMNHTRRLDIEFPSTEITILANDMTQLPFNVSLPTFVTEQYSLLGARYCSMSGNLAAHLKLIDRKTNKKISLFMTQMVDDLKYVETDSQEINGVDVRLWREGGLFYAMASASS